MSGDAYNDYCSKCRDWHGIGYDCQYGKAHKPAPNESPSSPRTSGSPTGSRSDSVEGTAVQLAPVLRPAVGAALCSHEWQMDTYPHIYCRICGNETVAYKIESI